MKSMGVEATACMGKRLAAAEIFLEHSGIALGCAEGLGLRLARRWNKSVSYYDGSETGPGIRNFQQGKNSASS